MFIKPKFIIFFFLCIVHSDELSDALEQSMRQDIVPDLETEVTHELLTLGITQFASKDNLALYRNKDTYAIEIQPFVPVYNPVKVPTKEQIDLMIVEQRPIAHKTFMDSAIFFKDLLLVDTQVYNLFNTALGIAPKTVLTPKRNIKGFLYSKDTSDNKFLNVRLYINRNFKLTSTNQQNQQILSKRFSGPRIGACMYDNDVLDRFEKAQTTKGYEVQSANFASPARGKDYSFEYNVALLPISKELFIFFDLAAIDIHQKDKMELIVNQSMLALSRNMLSVLGNIGYYNNDDSCYFTFGMTAYDTTSNFRDYFTFNTQYLKKYKIFHLEDNSTLRQRAVKGYSKTKLDPLRHIKAVRKQCGRVSDNIFTWDYLGTRNTAKDRGDGKFTFKAFDKGQYTNYVYTLKDQVGFGATEIIGAAKEYLIEWVNCFYHDDQHFINFEFGEIYLIVFTFDNEAGIELPNLHSKTFIEESKQPDITELETPVRRKVANKAALPQFNNLKMKAAAEVEAFGAKKTVAPSERKITAQNKNPKPKQLFGQTLNEGKQKMKFII